MCRFCASLVQRSKNGFGELALNHVGGHQANAGSMDIDIRIPLGCGPYLNSAPQEIELAQSATPDAIASVVRFLGGSFGNGRQGS